MHHRVSIARFDGSVELIGQVFLLKWFNFWFLIFKFLVCRTEGKKWEVLAQDLRSQKRYRINSSVSLMQAAEDHALSTSARKKLEGFQATLAVQDWCP